LVFEKNSNFSPKIAIKTSTPGFQFMYYGEVRIPNSDLEPLIRTATSLKIKGLSTHFRPPSTPPANVAANVTATPPKKRRVSNDADDRRHSPDRANHPSGIDVTKLHFWAENSSDKFSSSNFGQFSTQKPRYI
jgi:hypothetical protein